MLAMLSHRFESKASVLNLEPVFDGRALLVDTGDGQMNDAAEAIGRMLTKTGTSMAPEAPESSTITSI